MIISAILVKKPRAPRLCPVCKQTVRPGENTIRLYGKVDRLRAPHAVYVHPWCLAWGQDPKIDAVLRDVYPVESPVEPVPQGGKR